MSGFQIKKYYFMISLPFFRLRWVHPAGNYMFHVNNRNTGTRCKISHWRRFGVFIVNLEHISHLVLVFLLLTLSSKQWVKNIWFLNRPLNFHSNKTLNLQFLKHFQFTNYSTQKLKPKLFSDLRLTINQVRFFN